MALVPVYLPMAETAIDGLLLVSIGSGVGLLSGLFGVGGGFLITPLLIFLGVPPAVAAATGANTVIASSASGALAHWRRGTLDVKMGLLLLAGGLAGSAASVKLFGILAAMGQIDLVVSLSYVLLLGSVGAMMFAESVRGFLPGARKAITPPAARVPLGANLPWKTAFPRSGVETSVLAPIMLGFLVGVLTGLMGVGGGFLLVPAMIYLLAMPTTTVVGTSLFQILFVSANVTFLQAWSHQTVDVVLASLLVVGGVVAAPYGAKLGARLGAARLRVLLAMLVLGVAIGLGVGLVRQPADLYSIRIDVDAATKGETP
ncbi:MAG: TSUP family transporter [Alphaproteobacteria bacterium]|nr:TSUP family transporter [Alphaproteobacteria bacterium]